MRQLWSVLCLLVLIILIILTAMVISRCETLDTLGGSSAASEVSLATSEVSLAASGGSSGHDGHMEWLSNQLSKPMSKEEHHVGGHPLDANTYTQSEILIRGGKDLKNRDTAHWTTEEETITHLDKADNDDNKIKESKVSKRVAKKNWQSYKTWDDLKKDPGASAEYFAIRSEALNNPQYDWSHIYDIISPLLDEPREYVGVVGVEADNKTLKLIASEASPDAIGEGVSSNYFAGVPAELVGKYAERPALFFFHTHPADVRASPLPSSPDLATAIYFGATARFAASVVISRFGVLIYGLGWSGYKAINKANDWKLALLNYTHDTIAANESVRSWNWHNLRDYTDLYARMRLFFYTHPSPQMIAAGLHPPIMHSIESDIDHTIIDEYSADITRHLSGKKKLHRHKTAANKSHIWSNYREVPLTLDI